MSDPTTLNALAEEANAITEASSLGLTSERLARLCRSIARLCRSIVSRMSIIDSRAAEMEADLRAANDSLKKAGQRIDQLGERVEVMEDGWDIDGEGDGKFRTILLLGDDQRQTLSFNRPKERDEFSRAAAAFFRQWREARRVDTCEAAGSRSPIADLAAEVASFQDDNPADVKDGDERFRADLILGEERKMAMSFARKEDRDGLARVVALYWESTEKIDTSDPTR